MKSPEREELELQLFSYGIEDVAYCKGCGAYTFTHENGQEYSCHRKNLEEHFPDIDWNLFRQFRRSIVGNRYWNCNHCVNKWGLDLCACGSGFPPDKCENKYEECGKQMQEWKKHTHVCGSGSWGS